MRQNSMDVRPAYRRKNSTSAVTSRLALEILERGKAPFYSATGFNVASIRNDIECGFRPAWVEMAACPTDA